MRRIMQMVVATLLLPIGALYAQYIIHFSIVTFGLGNIEEWSRFSSLVLIASLCLLLFLLTSGFFRGLANISISNRMLVLLGMLGLAVCTLFTLNDANMAQNMTLSDTARLIGVCFGPLGILFVIRVLQVKPQICDHVSE